MTPGSLSASLTLWDLWEVTLAASSCSSRPVAMLREPVSPARASTSSARWSAMSRTLQAMSGTSSVHRRRTISRTLPSPKPGLAAPRRRRHEDAHDDAGVRVAGARAECAPNPFGANEVSRPGELHPGLFQKPQGPRSGFTAGVPANSLGQVQPRRIRTICGRK
jgi:hypothetical protein